MPKLGEYEGLQGRYDDKVVIVTGGSMGIGEGCVRAFHAAGAHPNAAALHVKDKYRESIYQTRTSLHVKDAHGLHASPLSAL